MKAIYLIITAVILAVIFAAGCTSAYQPPAQQPSQAQEPPATAPPAETTPPPTGAEKTVQITADGFNPATIEINAGDTVTWVNMDSVPHRPASAQHPTHLLYPESGGCIGSRFDSCKDLAQGESWPFQFNQAGEWRYHDHLNCCGPGSKFGAVVVKSPTEEALVVEEQQPAEQPPAEQAPAQPLKEEAAMLAVSVVLKSLPKVAAAGREFSVSWSITGEQALTSHTAVHYGRQSVPNPKSPADYAFTSRIFCTSASCKVPSSFQVPITIQEEGIYYYRAHTIIGGSHYWSDEASINVSKAQEVMATPSYGGGGY